MPPDPPPVEQPLPQPPPPVEAAAAPAPAPATVQGVDPAVAEVEDLGLGAFRSPLDDLFGE